MKMIIEVGSLTRNEIDNVLFQIDEGCSSLQLTEDEAKWATTLIESARDALFKWEVPTAEPVAHADMLAALKNLVERKLIKDTDGDHYDEVLEAIAKAEGRA